MLFSCPAPSAASSQQRISSSKEELQEVTTRLPEKSAKYETEEGRRREAEATAYRVYHLLYYQILTSSHR